MGSSPSFPPGTSLLFTLSKDSTHLLHRICEVQVYIHDKVLCECTTFSKQTNSKNWTRKVISCLNTTYNSVVAFVIGSVFMIFIMYKLCMYLRKHCNNTPRPRIEPKALGKILPPPELSNQGQAVNKEGIST